MGDNVWQFGLGNSLYDLLNLYIWTHCVNQPFDVSQSASVIYVIGPEWGDVVLLKIQHGIPLFI